jgi:primosomal protein N' (replication factor Y)
MTTGFGLVALPLPLAEPYTYRIPPELAARAVPGARVLVPVRRRQLTGIVVGLDVPPPETAARDILAAPDTEPAVPAGLLRTAEWISRYYGTPLGLTLGAILPTAVWGTTRPGGTPAMVTERVVTLGPHRMTLVERETAFKRTPGQRRLYEALEELGGTSATRHLREQLGFSDALVAALARRGLVEIARAERVRDPFAGDPGTPPPESPTEAQRRALEEIAGLGPGETGLLFGVTGSGKTFVYLEAVRASLEAGKGAIILVPEISLTPQTVARVRGALGDQVAVLHSGLSDGERADAWRLLRRGDRQVAVGARSAIFAPVRNLGLIVLDEEHEASYKNGEAPRYHARDVAAVRARLEGARLVLGSATPSPETMVRLAEDVRLIRLPRRIGDRPLPPVEIVDLRSAERVEKAGAVPWSAALDQALLEALARKEQALLLLNRRGFASFLQCADCGAVEQCPRCSISLTVHHTPRALRCHYCGFDAPIPARCRECGGDDVQQMRGVGTQQLERMLAARFPEARVARMDLDTTSTRWSHHRILGAVERGDVDVLIGTQMIAKGLDFPNVTLVGVVDADTGLHLPDFRAAERTFQLLAQVSGRAGRGPRGGRVLIQTRRPDHHAVCCAARHDPEAFLAEEMQDRQAPPYPPVVSLANVVVSGQEEAAVSAEAVRVADWCASLVARHELPVTILGPAPCPLARIKDRWRWHLLLKGASEEIGKVVRYSAGRITSAGPIRVIIDRDPVSLL